MTKMEIWLQVAREEYPNIAEFRLTYHELYWLAASDYNSGPCSKFHDLFEKFLIMKSLMMETHK